MSNLRSDCRALVADLPVGDVIRSHMERACYQIDLVEEYWHAAERKSHSLETVLRAVVDCLRVNNAESELCPQCWKDIAAVLPPKP